MLSQNKKEWDSQLKYAFWVDIVRIKRSIGNYPFQLVYRLEDIFPIQLSLPVMKLLQDEEAKSNDMQRIINQLTKVQQLMEQV
jgi:hypothetical protein